MSTGLAALAQLPLPFAPVRPACPAPVIAAASNEQARIWLARSAEWPQHRLALWGPPASGKSRMLAAWAAPHCATLLAGSALRFPASVGALACGPLAIDDAAAADPHALLHVLNAAHEAGHSVLLADATPPARWTVDLPDLASRLRAITAVAIEAPEDELLRALLARLLAERQLRPAESTLAWLLARLPRTHAAIAAAVARLDPAAQALGTAIAPPLARLVLPDLLADVPDPSPDGDIFAAISAPTSPTVWELL